MIHIVFIPIETSIHRSYAFNAAKALENWKGISLQLRHNVLAYDYAALSSRYEFQRLSVEEKIKFSSLEFHDTMSEKTPLDHVPVAQNERNAAALPSINRVTSTVFHTVSPKRLRVYKQTKKNVYLLIILPSNSPYVDHLNPRPFYSPLTS